MGSRRKRPASWARGLLAAALLVVMPGTPNAAALQDPAGEPPQVATPEDPATLGADRVLLVNGDRISGRLLGMTGGLLAVETPYAPRLEVAFDEVATLSTVRSVSLVLSGDEEVSGMLRGTRTGEVWVEPEDDLPGFSLPLTRILAIDPPPPSPPVRYLGSLGIAASFQRGNTWHTALSADARGERKRPEDRTEVRFRWQDVQEERDRVSNSTFGAAKYERSLSNGVYAFAGAEALSDSHRDLRLRSVASLGAGYELVDREDAGLAIEVGASYLRRNFIIAPDQEELTVRLAGRLRWLLFHRLEVRDQLVAYPSFEEGGVQLRNELEISSALFGRWALKGSWVVDFDSQAPPGLDEIDHLVLLGLQYTYH